MDRSVKDTKNTTHISRRINLLINSEKFNLHKTLWCEVGLQLAELGTNTVREDELNPRLGYDMVIILLIQRKTFMLLPR